MISHQYFLFDSLNLIYTKNLQIKNAILVIHDFSRINLISYSVSPYRVQVQLISTIYFIRKVIEYADLPQKITENLLCIMRPGSMDFQEQSWLEAMAPYVDYLYSMYQVKETQNQFYDNITFRNDNFSLTRFSKQLKHVLSVLTDISADDKKTMENTFIIEENESTINATDDSEWSYKLNPSHEIISADNE